MNTNNSNQDGAIALRGTAALLAELLALARAFSILFAHPLTSAIHDFYQ